MSKTKLITAYYIIGLVALVSQVVYTVYQGSVVISHGQQLSRLERQKQVLAQKQQQLKQTVAGSSSLLSLSQSSQYNQFQPISQTYRVDDTLTVALR